MLVVDSGYLYSGCLSLLTYEYTDFLLNQGRQNRGRDPVLRVTQSDGIDVRILRRTQIFVGQKCRGMEYSRHNLNGQYNVVTLMKRSRFPTNRIDTLKKSHCTTLRATMCQKREAKYKHKKDPCHLSGYNSTGSPQTFLLRTTTMESPKILMSISIKKQNTHISLCFHRNHSYQ